MSTGDRLPLVIVRTGSVAYDVPIPVRDEIDHLRGELEQARADYQQLLKNAAGDLTQAEAQRDKLAAALRKRGHAVGCNHYSKLHEPRPPCDCGLDAALAGGGEKS